MTLVDIEPRTQRTFRTFRTLPQSFCTDAVTYSCTSVSVTVTVQAEPHNGDLDVAMNDGIHVIAEVNSAGVPQKSYTWGPGIDNLLAWTDYTGGETNTYYAITDIQGSVMAVTDSSGSIVESYRFDAWGKVLGVYSSSGQPLSESAIDNHYLHQGRWYSWETGLYFHRARWRDPVIGRWLSKDPSGISGGLNMYEFCRSNPVNFVDPLGLWDTLRGVGDVAGIVGGLVEIGSGGKKIGVGVAAEVFTGTVAPGEAAIGVGVLQVIKGLADAGMSAWNLGGNIAGREESRVPGGVLPLLGRSVGPYLSNDSCAEEQAYEGELFGYWIDVGYSTLTVSPWGGMAGAVEATVFMIDHHR